VTLSPDEVLPLDADPDAFASFVESLNEHARRGEWGVIVTRITDILELGEGREFDYLRAAVLMGAAFWTRLGLYTSGLLLQCRGRKFADSDPGADLRRFIRHTHAQLCIAGERRGGRPRVRTTTRR
jgi:hypothetical protein